MVPVVVLAIMTVIQFGLLMYAQRVVTGAAQDAATAAARVDAGPDAGRQLADQLIGDSAGNLITSHHTTVTVDGGQVRVVTTGSVVRLIPFISAPTVTGRSAARLETFDPQGNP